MNNKDFLTHVARSTGLKQTDAQAMMNTLIEAMGQNFAEGNTVQVPALGVFEVKKRLERVMVNPTTGQRMLVPPKLTLSFRPSTTLRDKIRKGGDDNG